MKFELAALARSSCFALCVLSVGCSDPSETAALAEESREGPGLPEIIEFCAIRSGASVNGEDVDRAIETAESDLKARKESRPYRFVRGVRSVSGEMVLLFEDLRLSDTFQVYLIDGSTGSITENYALSGLYYEEHACPSAQLVVR